MRSIRSNNNDNNNESDSNLSIDEFSILTSLLFALLHCLFEGLIIYLDSRACQMSFFHYGIQCLGARLEWYCILPVYLRCMSVVQNEDFFLMHVCVCVFVVQGAIY